MRVIFFLLRKYKIPRRSKPTLIQTPRGNFKTLFRGFVSQLYRSNILAFKDGRHNINAKKTVDLFLSLR